MIVILNLFHSSFEYMCDGYKKTVVISVCTQNKVGIFHSNSNGCFNLYERLSLGFDMYTKISFCAHN